MLPSYTAEPATEFHGSVGLQLYSLRNYFKTDGIAALDHAVKLGFKEVECGLLNPYGLTQEEMKEGLKKRGLTMVSGMTQYNDLLKNMDQVIEAAKFFGVKTVGIGSAPRKDPLDEEQALKLAENFNTFGKQLKNGGLQFYYHIHGFEFQPLGNGETTFDLIVRKTDPELVKFEMDVLWALLPGQDPAKLLKKYPDRWLYVHLKDLAPGIPQGNHSGRGGPQIESAVGYGQADYPAILKAAQEVGIKHYFIEDETDDVLTEIPKSLQFLSTVKLPSGN